MPSDSCRFSRVLVIRLSAMGDAAMTSPIVSAACQANPDVHFDFLSVPFHEPFFQQYDNFGFIGTNIKKEKHGLVAIWKLFRKLKKNNYDAVIDLHDVLRTKILRRLFALSGVKVYAIDKGRSEKKALVSGKCRRQLRPMTQRYADVFKKAGLALADGLQLMPRRDVPHQSPVSHKNAEMWVGISPFAQHRGKMYPAEQVAQLVDALLLHDNVRLFIFGGGKSEKEQADALVTGRDRCHNVIGLMKLDDEMALMSNLDVMVSMDSSAMHLCSLFGVRVVSIWGQTHPYAGFLGYGQNETNVVQRNDLPCRPCSVFGNKPCRLGDFRCLDVNPQDVVSTVLS